jgi:hypothetical protein
LVGLTRLFGGGSFKYKGIDFVVDADCIYAVLADTEQPLPELFESELQTGTVEITAIEPPQPLLATPGWYDGKNYGRPDCYVLVDPTGRVSNASPPIYVYAYGKSHDAVVTFLRFVMAGTPRSR